MSGCTCLQILNQQSNVKTLLQDEYAKIDVCKLLPTESQQIKPSKFRNIYEFADNPF